MQRPSLRVMTLLAANALAVCMLGFYSTTTAAPQGQPPFIDAAEQRAEMVQQLREIKELLKEQNSLLRSGIKSANHETQPRK